MRRPPPPAAACVAPTRRRRPGLGGGDGGSGAAARRRDRPGPTRRRLRQVRRARPPRGGRDPGATQSSSGALPPPSGEAANPTQRVDAPPLTPTEMLRAPAGRATRSVLHPTPLRADWQAMFGGRFQAALLPGELQADGAQIQIIQTIIRGIDGGVDVLIDSPTGTGKTLAPFSRARHAAPSPRSSDRRARGARAGAQATVRTAAAAPQQQPPPPPPAAAGVGAPAADGATAHAAGCSRRRRSATTSRCSQRSQRPGPCRRRRRAVGCVVSRAPTPAQADGGRARDAVQLKIAFSPRESTTTTSPRRQGGGSGQRCARAACLRREAARDGYPPERLPA